MLNLNIENVEQTEERVITLKFIGTLDFKINEYGELLDGNKTFTYTELYNAINPAVVEDETIEEVETTQY